MDRILIFNIIFIALLLFVILIDIVFKFIPNLLNILILVVAIYFKWPDFSNIYLSASLYILPLVIIYGYGSDLLNKEILGFGDIKLTLSLAIVLFNPLKETFTQIYMFYFWSFIPAAIFSIIVLLFSFRKRKRNNKKRVIAFSPFLVISFLINYFAYDYIVQFMFNYV